MASDEDVLQHGHVGEEPDVLEGAGDACLGDQVGLGRQDGALVADRALGGDVQPGEAVEEGGLAGAVGADESDDLARVDGEVDPLTAVRPPKRMVTPLASSTVVLVVCVVVVMLSRPRLGDGEVRRGLVG